MSAIARKAIAILARRIVKDPTKATLADADKLARAVLILLGEKIQ